MGDFLHLKSLQGHSSEKSLKSPRNGYFPRLLPFLFPEKFWNHTSLKGVFSTWVSRYTENRYLTMPFLFFGIFSDSEFLADFLHFWGFSFWMPSFGMVFLFPGGFSRGRFLVPKLFWKVRGWGAGSLIDPRPRAGRRRDHALRNGPGPLASSFFVENTNQKKAIFLDIYKIIVGSRVIIAIFWKFSPDIVDRGKLRRSYLHIYLLLLYITMIIIKIHCKHYWRDPSGHS